MGRQADLPRRRRGRSPHGPSASPSFTPAEPTDDTFGVWMGATSAGGGLPWWHVRGTRRTSTCRRAGARSRRARRSGRHQLQRLHADRGRVPFDAAAPTRPRCSRARSVPAPGGLPLGTELYLTTDRFDVAPGRAVHVTVRARAAAPGSAARRARSRFRPAGRQTRAARPPRADRTPRRRSPSRAPADATGRVRIGATLRAGGRTGTSSALVRVVPAVQGTVQRLPQVAHFRAWARRPACRSSAAGSSPSPDRLGETRSVRVDLHNWSGSDAVGDGRAAAPAGLQADAASQPYSGSRPGPTRPSRSR